MSRRLKSKKVSLEFKAVFCPGDIYWSGKYNCEIELLVGSGWWGGSKTKTPSLPKIRSQISPQQYTHTLRWDPYFYGTVAQNHIIWVVQENLSLELGLNLGWTWTYPYNTPSHLAKAYLVPSNILCEEIYCHPRPQIISKNLFSDMISSP